MKDILNIEKKTIFKRFICVVLSLCIISTLLVNSIAQDNIKNKFLLKIMSDESKKELCVKTMGLLDKDFDVDFVLVMMQFSDSLSKLSEQDRNELKGVLTRYKMSTDETKDHVKTAVEGFKFETVALDTTGFKQTAADFNTLVTGQASDENGMKFILSLLKYVNTFNKVAFTNDSDKNHDFLTSIKIGDNNLNKSMDSFLEITEFFKDKGITKFSDLVNKISAIIKSHPTESTFVQSFLTQKILDNRFRVLPADDALAIADFNAKNTELISGYSKDTGSGMISAKLEALKTNLIISRIAGIVSETNVLNGKYKASGIEKKIDSALILKISSNKNKNTNEIDFELPTVLLKSAIEKKLDRITVQTDLANISIPSDAIDIEGAKVVNISVKKISNEEFSEVVEPWRQVYEFTIDVNGQKLTSFKNYLTVSIPYNPKVDEDPEKLTVFYIGENGILQNFSGSFDKTSEEISFQTNHFSKYFVQCVKTSFEDISNYSWAQKAIEVMAAKGIVSGIGARKYTPGSILTRSQFAAMLVKQSNLTDVKAPNIFKDVPASAWYSNFVASAYKNGLIRGTSKDTFDPEAPVSRQDMAVMIANTMKVSKGKSGLTNVDFCEKYTDKSDISEYAKNAISYITKYSIMKGQSDGSFVPKMNSTRAEAAVVVYALFNIK